MLRCYLSLLAVMLCCARPVLSGGQVVFGDDGSVTGQFPCGSAQTQRVVLKFGLPAVPVTRLWQEGQTLRGLWITNGVRYTQTVFFSAGHETTPSTGWTNSSPVLLVNIEGDNTNSDYAEAFAHLAVEIDAQPQELQLENGLVWRGPAARRVLLGALEIPDSGVRVSHGKTLRFSGNMPPSLKGCMTLKLPLRPLTAETEAESLKDLDVENELRRSLKTGTEPPPGNAHRLVFAKPGT